MKEWNREVLNELTAPVALIVKTRELPLIVKIRELPLLLILWLIWHKHFNNSWYHDWSCCSGDDLMTSHLHGLTFHDFDLCKWGRSRLPLPVSLGVERQWQLQAAQLPVPVPVPVPQDGVDAVGPVGEPGGQIHDGQREVWEGQRVRALRTGRGANQQREPGGGPRRGHADGITCWSGVSTQGLKGAVGVMCGPTAGLGSVLTALKGQ